MSVHTLAQGARSSAVLALGTLAAGTYVTSSAIDLGAAIPIDVTFEFIANANGTPTGNKQAVLFVKFSLDNTNWSTGPESGTDDTNELDMQQLGTLPMNDTNDHRNFFSLAGLPITRYIKLVAKNDCGVAFTDGNVYRADITGVTT